MSAGGVYSNDAIAIRDQLRKEMENGNRFVSFPTGKQGLTKDDFVVFRTAVDAHEHAYSCTTDRERYVVRSISAVEKGMDELLHLDRDKGLLAYMKKEIGELLSIVESVQQKRDTESSRETNDRALSR